MPGQIPMAGVLALKQRAAQGDPSAVQELQMLGMGGPQGAPQQPQMPPQGAMSQSDFGNGGKQVPPDVQAKRAKQLIELLRARQ